VGVVINRVGTVVVHNWYCSPSVRLDLVQLMSSVAKLIATSTDNKVVDVLCFSGALCTSRMSPSTKVCSSISVVSLRSLLGPNRFGQQMASSLLHQSTLGASESESEAGIVVCSFKFKARGQYLVRVETLSPLPHPVPHHRPEQAQKISKPKKKCLLGEVNLFPSVEREEQRHHVPTIE